MFFTVTLAWEAKRSFVLAHGTTSMFAEEGRHLKLPSLLHED